MESVIARQLETEKVGPYIVFLSFSKKGIKDTKELYCHHKIRVQGQEYELSKGGMAKCDLFIDQAKGGVHAHYCESFIRKKMYGEFYPTNDRFCTKFTDAYGTFGELIC